MMPFIAPLAALQLAVVTGILPLSDHHCMDSFYAVGNNVATAQSRYAPSKGGPKTLINSYDNEIVKISTFAIGASPEILGFIYTLGDGERYVSGRSAVHPLAQRRLYQILSVAKKARAVFEGPSTAYMALYPSRYVLSHGTIASQICVPEAH